MRVSVKISNLKNAIASLKKVKSDAQDTTLIDETIQKLQDDLDFWEELNRDESD